MFNFFRKKKTDATVTFPFKVDVHAHVLPGIDDGSPDLDYSIKLIRRMYDMGIRAIVATPHITAETFPNNRQTIEAAYSLLKEELAKQKIEMQLFYAAENRLDELFDQNYKRKELMLFPDKKTVLIENSFLQPRYDLKEVIFDMITDGYQPVLAHLERYPYYFENDTLLNSLKGTGCYVQVNLLSLAGYYGKGPKLFALDLLAAGLVDFIATDVHRERQLFYLKEYMQGKEYKKKVLPLILNNQLLNDELFLG